MLIDKLSCAMVAPTNVLLQLVLGKKFHPGFELFEYFFPDQNHLEEKKKLKLLGNYEIKYIFSKFNNTKLKYLLKLKFSPAMSSS